MGRGRGLEGRNERRSRGLEVPRRLPEIEAEILRPGNRWVTKGVTKLWEASKNNPAKFYSVLSGAGLVRFLWDRGYLMHFPAEEFLEALSTAEHFALREYPQVEAILFASPDQRLRVRRAILRFAETPDDFLKLYDTSGFRTDATGRALIGGFVEDTLDRFLASGPSPAQIAHLETTGCQRAACREKLKRALSERTAPAGGAPASAQKLQPAPGLWAKCLGLLRKAAPKP